MFLILMAVFFFLFWDLVYLILGLLFVRFKFSHRFGLRMLAMSIVFPKKMLPHRCRLDFEFDECGNWTCSDYHRYPNK